MHISTQIVKSANRLIPKKGDILKYTSNNGTYIVYVVTNPKHFEQLKQHTFTGFILHSTHRSYKFGQGGVYGIDPDNSHNWSRFHGSLHVKSSPDDADIPDDIDDIPVDVD